MMRILAPLTVAAMALSLAACGSDSDQASGKDLTVRSGVLTVCSDVPYAPFEDFDESAPSGFSGFDIDIVSAVAEGLDLDLQVKDSSFDALESGTALNSKQCDLAASAITVTEQRAKNLAFSDGYYDSQQSLLVKDGSPVKSIDDLKGKRVGVQVSTTGETYAEENSPKGTKVVGFPSDAEMFQALKSGVVDALLQDLPVNVNHARQGGYTVVGEYPTDEVYGLAMRKDNTELVEAVNGELKELRDSGKYQDLYDTYFSAK